MSTKQLFIPQRIKVGFQKRGGTYTGKLAYVIYFDSKGTLRKEKSWQNWRDEKIKPVEFDNDPTTGFVLNKGVGGARQSYGWNTRNEYIRVWDPRDFEFEISVANLLFILRECDCSRGKGLEGNFVYAWDGTELVLLPECSTDYQESQKFSALQGESVAAKDLIAGASYLTKQQESLTYLGRYEYHFPVSDDTAKKRQKGVLKMHIFWNGKDFVPLDSMKSLAKLESEEVAPNYAELVQAYYKSKHGTKVAELFLKESANILQADYYGSFHHQEPDGTFLECQGNYSHSRTNQNILENVTSRYQISLDNNGVIRVHNEWCLHTRDGKKPSGYYWYHTQNIRSWIEPTKNRLYARLESGSVYRVLGDRLYDEKKEKRKNG